jgi:hypothetical protein
VRKREGGHIRGEPINDRALRRMVRARLIGSPGGIARQTRHQKLSRGLWRGVVMKKRFGIWNNIICPDVVVITYGCESRGAESLRITARSHIQTERRGDGDGY